MPSQPASRRPRRCTRRHRTRPRLLAHANRYPYHRFARADFHAGRRRQTGLAKFRHRITRFPRWLLLGLDGHDPDCLFWAARREVFADINLAAGAARYLPAIVARRGFRACEIFVEHQGLRRPLQDIRPTFGDLLATWWQCLRWRNSAAYELTAGRAAQPLLRRYRPRRGPSNRRVHRPLRFPRITSRSSAPSSSAVKHA